MGVCAQTLTNATRRLPLAPPAAAQDDDAAGAAGAADEDDEDDDEDASDSEEPRTLGAAAAAAAAASAPGGAGRRRAVVEALPRGAPGGALSAAQRAAAVAHDAPELAALAEELRATLDEVRGRAAPLLAAVRSGEFASGEGISYLEAKHLLLLSYCVNIVFYVLLKAEGRSVRDHPVVLRLVEARAFLEKARPIDKKLAYQLDKLLRLAAAGEAGDAEGEAAAADAAAAAAAGGDALAFRPNPDMLLPANGAPGARGGRGGGAASDGLYRPPKLAPAAMDGYEDGEPGGAAGRAARSAAERRRRAAKSQLVQALAEELDGAPREERGDAATGGESAFVRREADRLARRAAEEEDLFVRVPLSKTERARAAAAGRKAVGLSAQVGDFGDDVGDIVEAVAELERARAAGRGSAGGGGGGVDAVAAPAPKRVRLSAVAAAAAVSAHNARAAQLPASGEVDVPMRQGLGERRMAFERRAGARDARAAMDAEDGGADAGRGGDRADISDDDMYTAAAEAAAARRAAKRATYGTERFAPVFAEAEPGLERDEEGDAAKRGITGAMASNRGLTPHRNKALKNPRKKHRVKFEKALVRRKGAVREVVPGAAGGYGGEATGIKSTVSRSRKL
jgi:U3 small nucleolar RNA-associated protein 3